jgi:2-polyprenyl-6-methoxyphenol hydroxylase-like FAD-dependent oxidoreductase
MDSLSAQGISNALRDADRLARAVVEGLGGARPLAAALADHHRDRDQGIRAMYDFTVGLTRFRSPNRAQRLLFTSLAQRPDEIERLLGAFAGITPIDAYLSAGNILRVLASRERPVCELAASLGA